jgi:hypothetical protein
MAKRIAGLRPSAKSSAPDQIGKRLIFDRETWNAVDLLARDQMKDLQELTEEAFRDLLKKHGRTADFREALRLSAKSAAATGKPGKAAPRRNSRAR